MTPRARMLAVSACCSIAAAAHADTLLYSKNFETNAPDPRWSNLRWDSQPAFTGFAGRYSNSWVSVSLPEAPPPGLGVDGNDGPPPTGSWYRLVFDFYAIDSWDGENTVNGKDRFGVAINGVTLFDETFDNQNNLWQSYRGPTVGPQHLGYNAAFRDSIYRDIEILFQAEPGAGIIALFGDSGLQGLSDESWGIDNVRLYTTNVPAPGFAGLALSAILLNRRGRPSDRPRA